MSRTDVHRPYHIQLADPHNRPHLARFGATVYVPGRNWGCGCNLCTGHYFRIFDRRRERAAWRAVRQQLRKTVPSDRDSMDVPPLRFQTW